MSKKATYSFGNLPTLSKTIWSADKIKNSWKWRDRSMETIMQRFIDLNKQNFAYLGVSANIENIEGKLSLALTTSNYIGSIPILSPMNGKPIGDIHVTGRYGEDASELISLLDRTVHPEYKDSLKLTQDTQLSPPIFIECCKYIDTYIEAERFHWHKFTNITREQHLPSGATLWKEYAVRTAKNPLSFDIFKNKSNELTTEHPEWNQLNYVLKLAISELESSRVPMRTRATYYSRVALLKTRLQSKQIETISKLKERMADPQIIKQLKELANIILRGRTCQQVAWRLDYAEFFERYVQFLMDGVAKQKGARNINNPHYRVSVFHQPSWGLAYLEPDIILQRDKEQYVVDAKYKSHMFNWFDNNEELKDTFRHDLHQVLAYCSFNSMQNKRALLVYPYNDFTFHKLAIRSPHTDIENTIYLVGVPMERNRIADVVKGLVQIITFA